MKRIKLMATAAIMAAVAIAGYMGYTAYEYATMTPQERLMLANIEALTISSEFPAGWYSNFTMANLWYNTEAGLQVGLSSKPTISIFSNWKSMSCCVNSTDSNACNFNNEDSDCKNYVIRNSRN